MNQARRLLLKGTLATGAIGMAVGAGLLSPRQVMAAWPKDAFEAKKIEDAVGTLLGGAKTEDAGDKIEIKAPDIAENGAVVPITISTTKLKNVESISLLVAENASPLVASFQLAPNAEATASTRIKMGKTSDVVAVVKADGKLYRASKSVKVTIGGCGG